MAQIIPAEHVRASPKRMSRAIDEVLSAVGVRGGFVVTDPSYPDDAPYEPPGLTPWPFLLVPVSGRLSVAYVSNGRVQTCELAEGEPVLYAANTWPSIERSHIRAHFRATFADDGILLGVRDWREGTPGRNAPPGRLELYLLPGPVPSRILSLLGMATESGGPYAAMRITQVLTLVLTELSRLVAAIRTDQSSPPGKAAATWLALREYLRQHAHESPSREQTSVALGITARHVSRLCRSFGDCGYLEMLDRLRLERARALLASSGMSVKQVAYACGFGSVSYFIRVFRRRMGCTPGVWQRKRS